MEKILEKIEIYHFINYLLPGIVFMVSFNNIYENEFISGNAVISAVEYYFIGLILSRIGSVILQPIFKKINFIKYADYEKYIKASDMDNKLEILQREANQYRTYIVTFTLLAIIQATTGNFSKSFWIWIGISVLFIMAYKKQINFIVDRVEKSYKK